ncbi:79edc2a7-b16c-4ff6-b653-ce9d61058cbe [Thermothielavioides terrestris]|uniref:79edc2a7-b16c-4ff6-b653-ce9d61058cbe n=1 Tax=Thermothielavioides terrestris TaxID=2587410 RepID=A0A446BMM6_9PEZI|nr:79edc2a7-b16c-4ff6-b653-ce9d61058cbe [Thermothielavioides terrestris]
MSAPPAPAPWRAPFLAHISLLPTPTFTLATLHPAPPAEAPSPAMPCLPRARTCVFRGLWASPLPSSSSSSSSRNKAPRNPPLYESDLPVFTTDARTDKVAEILDSGSGEAIAASGGATGGGGPVEAVFWVDAAPRGGSGGGGGGSRVRTQWRVRGRALVLGPDADADGAAAVREVLRRRMRRVRAGGAGGTLGGKEGEAEGEGEGEEEEEEEGWSFAREVTAHFGNLSPLMRGSFRAPPPGTPIAYHTEKGEAVGQRLDDLEDPVARRNFRVVVIVPDEVDQVDLSDELRPRRWLYVYRGESGESKLPGGEVIGEWEKVEVWP